MKKLLITLCWADGLHGGVRYSAEIGSFFNSIGYDVYVCGVITNDSTKEYFKKYNVKLFNISEFPTDIVFDIVWAHHWPIFPYLISRGVKYKRIINSTISEFLFIEKPMWFFKNIDLHVVLTENLKDSFVHDYNIDKRKIFVLPNTAPDEYFEYKYTPGDSLSSIAVVSNHPPAEVCNALDILKQKGFDTIIYGAGNSVDITPEILAQHDVIITIGKTVQYAMAMGIPVYNYDHFGGSGYITPDNVDIESKFNFSGRSFFTKKTSEQIAQEIVDNYKNVLQQQVLLKRYADEKYHLAEELKKILNKLEKTPKKRAVKVNSKNKIFFDYCGAFIDYFTMHNNQYIQAVDYFSKKKESKQRKYKLFECRKRNEWTRFNFCNMQILKKKSTDNIFVLYVCGLQVFKRVALEKYNKISLFGVRIFKYKQGGNKCQKK